jgi:hypothetical protein
MRIRILWLSLWLGLVGGSIFAVVLRLPPSRQPSSDRVARAGPPAVASPIDVGRLARERAQAALEAAAAQSHRAVAETLTEMDDLFVRQRQRLPELAGELVSPSAQWRYLADRLPLGPGGRQAAFVRRTLLGTLFDPAALDTALAGAMSRYIEAERDIDDGLLVRLRLDLADLPAPTAIALPGRLEPPGADRAGVLVDATASVRVELGHELAALAIGEVLAEVALRLGASAGLAGAGEMSAATTFGVGLAAGLAAERAIAWAFGDPRDTLAGRLGAALDELKKRVLDGTPGVPGLRAGLERATAGRIGRRQEIILQAIGEAKPR